VDLCAKIKHQYQWRIFKGVNSIKCITWHGNVKVEAWRQWQAAAGVMALMWLAERLGGGNEIIISSAYQ
jgi:hypothetical protein